MAERIVNLPELMMAFGAGEKGKVTDSALLCVDAIHHAMGQVEAVASLLNVAASEGRLETRDAEWGAALIADHARLVTELTSRLFELTTQAKAA